MQNCEKYRELCSASIDGELSPQEKRELSEHISKCPACAAYLDDLREMRNAWDDFKQPLTDDMHEYIMQAVLKEAERPVKTKRHFPVFTTFAAAAACVMLVLSGAVGDIINMTSNNTGDNTRAKPTGKLVMENTDEGETSSYIEPEQTEPEQPEEQPEQTQPVQPRVIEPAHNETKEQTEVTPRTSEVPKENVEQQTDKQTEQQVDNGKQVAPATFSVNPESKKNAAERQSVAIPSSLQTSSFAFCFVAVGSGDVPVIDNAEFIEKNNNTYYFKVTGVISDFDKTVLSLKEKGFETTMRDDLGVKIDANATNGLLVLVVNE